jgi:HSP90 family molecular chaperone
MWISDGSGTYEISEIDNPGFERGTKIIINLRPTCLMFSKYDEVKKIIQKYSNFINHPIYLNGNFKLKFFRKIIIKIIN